MSNNDLARNLCGQEPGRGNRHALAAGTPIVACGLDQGHKRGIAYKVAPDTGDPFTIRIEGRIKWTLDQLRQAGSCGCTPIQNPAPRRSAYVKTLREMGVPIETLSEPHEGDYPGFHSRYVLHATVTQAKDGAA